VPSVLSTAIGLLHFRLLPSALCLLPTAFCLLSTGCAASRDEREADLAVADFWAGDYRTAELRLEPLAKKPDENFVLNNLRLGLASLADYNLDEAESALLRAYEVINSVGVNDGGRSLGAALVNERIKIWKGEPFERAMANFYLGLVYYMRHDYGNARAAFENALFKLRDYGSGKTEGDEYRDVESDFALGYLMLGRCWQRLGDEDKARKNFDRAVELRRYLAPLADPAMNQASNLLLVVDYGHGPQKITYDGTIAGFGPRPEQVGLIPPPIVVIDGRPAPMNGEGRPPVDLLALAQDRRWQDIDTIRAVKSTIGTGLIGVGAFEGLRSRNSSNQLAGLGMVAAGALLKASSQADLRQWAMLPRTTFVLPLRVEPGLHDITVQFPDISGLRQTWRGLVVPPEGEATYYFHMQRYNPGPFNWPPPAMTPGNPPS
jgi:tetratricopeptide (TPR) repeat protein